jgi:hypothetical protein
MLATTEPASWEDWFLEYRRIGFFPGLLEQKEFDELVAKGPAVFMYAEEVAGRLGYRRYVDRWKRPSSG